MKKIVSIILVLVTVLSMGTMAFADGTTTLTTTVPAATYTLNIPADQKIDFGATETDIGFATVSNSSGFAVGKDLKVTITYTPFANENVTTTIPYTLTMRDGGYIDSSKVLSSGDTVIFKGKTDGTVAGKVYLGKGSITGTLFYADSCILKAKSEDWGKALGGDYTATITFTSEVVVE